MRGLACMVAALCAGAVAAQPGGDPRRSGFDFMGATTQAMQADDMQNPGMLWVAEGAALWQRKEGRSGRSCADCHDAGPAPAMRGVAARYPAFDAPSLQPVNLQQRINLCRARRQQAAELPLESRDLLSLESHVAHQSRGLPIEPAGDERLRPYRAQGQALYEQRMGQLHLSCLLCHDHHAGQRLGGSTIPQAHPTGYPVYRLEWQALGSLQRRLRGCMVGVRAEPFPYGSQELVALELYLAARAGGMRMEAPAVRP